MARAFATVSIGGIVVRDYRLVQGKSGTLFVTPPQRSWTGRGGQPHHTFVVDVPEPLRSEVQAAVLAACDNAVDVMKGGAVGVLKGGSAQASAHPIAPPKRVDVLSRSLLREHSPMGTNPSANTQPREQRSAPRI